MQGKKTLHKSDPSGGFLQPPQTTASKHLNEVPPLQTKFFAAPLKAQSDQLILC